MTMALIRIDAKTAAGSDSPVYLASDDVPELCHLDGEQWVPAIARLPTLRYDWFGGEFYGAITAPSAQFAVAKHSISGFDALYYADARVRVWAGTLADTTPASTLTLDLDFLTQTYQSDDGLGAVVTGIGGLDLRFDGVIEAEPRVDGGIAEFSASVDDKWLDKPLLDVYAGTDGIEGPEELTGLPKPLTFGAAKFCGGVLIDPTENVYQVHDGAVEGITAAYDRLCSLGASTGDYADLAALIAASIPAGSWGTCKALGLARLGAPADGLVSFHVSGGNTGSYVRKPGAIIDRIVDIAGGSANASSLTALDTARAYNLAIQIAQQTTAREVIQQIAGSVGAVAFVGWTGDLYVTPVAYGTAAGTLATDGSGDYPVGDIVRLPIASPFWRLATFAEPTWAVHSATDIATDYVLRGEYDAARVYRLDDAVSATDGRVFIYINATPGSGNAPPTAPTESNSYWSLFGPADVTQESTPRHEPSNTTLSFTANYQGTLDGGQLPATLQFKRYRGTTNVSTSATWSIVSQGAITGGTVTVSDGVVTIPDTCVIPPSTTITVRSVRDSFTIDSTIGVTRIDAAPPVPSGGGGGSGGGTSATDNSLNAVSGTTKVAVSDIMTVTTGSAGEITFAGNLSLSVTAADPEGTFGVAMRWKYRPISGSFSDVGATDITETTEAAVYYDSELDFYLRDFGSVNVAASLTGLSATTDYEVQLWGARDSSSPTKDVFFGGTVSATGS